MLNLNSDTTEFDWGSDASLLAADHGVGDLRQIEEDLSV